MRVRDEILATLIGLIAVPSAVLVFHFSGVPVQPVREARARVVAIAAREGKLYAGRDWIVVRNARGSGQFSMPAIDHRCHVGDVVPVDQQGVTLRRVAKTCR